MKKLTFLALLLWAASVVAQDRFAKVEVKATHLRGSVHMLTGAGGNIGVSAGADGILMVDDQFEPLAQRISDALDGIHKGPLRYVINTHYHGDHTGSNAFMREVRDATVFAHDNVRQRLADKEEHNSASLPVVTFAEGVRFHFNDETISVFHLAQGHTDGDSVVYFTKANVLHTGDLYFQGRFPYVDLKAGGTVQGYINSVDTMLSYIDEATLIIPGHGQLSNKQALQTFVNMLKSTAAEVAQMKNEGLSVEQAIAKGLDPKWQSWGEGWIKEERWITTLYQ